MTTSVNEHEGAVLGVIARRQPITRYQLLRAFQCSPVKSYNTSKGSLYPLIVRMVSRGLVQSAPGQGARQTEELSLSEKGYEALRLWVRAITIEHTLNQDPLKVRSISLGELNRSERIRWIANAKGLLLEKKDQLAAYHALVDLPSGDIVHSADDAELEAKLRWLDRLLIQVVDESKAQRVSTYKWADKSR